MPGRLLAHGKICAAAFKLHRISSLAPSKRVAFAEPLHMLVKFGWSSEMPLALFANC